MEFTLIKREERNGITRLGIIRNKDFPEEGNIRIIPYGKQRVEVVPVKIIRDENNNSEYISLTLYRQRNGTYKLKIKSTEVC